MSECLKQGERSKVMKEVSHAEDRPESELFTPSAAARFIRKSEGSMRVYAASGKLPCIRTSTGLRLFRRADLEKFISKQD
jgi:helix-turn-helix protein